MGVVSQVLQNFEGDSHKGEEGGGRGLKDLKFWRAA